MNKKTVHHSALSFIILALPPFFNDPRHCSLVTGTALEPSTDCSRYHSALRSGPFTETRTSPSGPTNALPLITRDGYADAANREPGRAAVHERGNQGPRFEIVTLMVPANPRLSNVQHFKWRRHRRGSPHPYLPRLNSRSRLESQLFQNSRGGIPRPLF